MCYIWTSLKCQNIKMPYGLVKWSPRTISLHPPRGQTHVFQSIQSTEVWTLTAAWLPSVTYSRVWSCSAVLNVRRWEVDILRFSAYRQRDVDMHICSPFHYIFCRLSLLSIFLSISVLFVTLIFLSSLPLLSLSLPSLSSLWLPHPSISLSHLSPFLTSLPFSLQEALLPQDAALGVTCHHG